MNEPVGGEASGLDTTGAARTSPLPRTDDRDPRPVLFHVVAAIGITIGLVLGILEILDRPTIRLGEERAGRDGLVSTVQVLATNTSDDTAFCVEIRIGALDREGLDLQEVVAVPQRGDGRLDSGQTVNFVAVFDELTQQDYDEELDEFVAYVDQSERC